MKNSSSGSEIMTCRVSKGRKRKYDFISDHSAMPAISDIYHQDNNSMYFPQYCHTVEKLAAQVACHL